MCGIFGFVGAPNDDDLKTVRQLAIVNYLRGVHATGVAVVTDKNVYTHKKAVDAITFVSGSAFKSVTDVKGKTAILGHCRQATMGSATDPDGAHPFQHGAITGMHNGTLMSRSGLSSDFEFEVDSEHVMYSLSQCDTDDDVVKLLEALDGAYALAWHDKRDNTINIARNDERELAYCVTTFGEFIYSSELAMLQAVIKRRNIKCALEPQEFPIGKWFSFPADIKLTKSLKEVTVVDFEPQESWTRWYNNYSSRRFPSSTTSRTGNTTNSRINGKAKGVLDALELSLDDEICYTPVEVIPYPNQDDYCMIEAVSLSEPFFDVTLHGVPTTSPAAESVGGSDVAQFKGRVIGVARAEDFDKTEPATANLVCFGMDIINQN
jgi:predicted glutamine amidotransferase